MSQPTSQRMSVGVTPKTLRQPKRGEMLLSVHGSPLGLYEEDNMGAIQGMPLNQKFHFLILDLETVGRRNAFIVF